MSNMIKLFMYDRYIPCIGRLSVGDKSLRTHWSSGLGKLQNGSLADQTLCLQAAQKALAELNGIPEPPSPLKAAHMRSSTLQPPDGDEMNSSDDFVTCGQPDSPLGSTATETGAASEKRQNRANSVAGEPHQRPLSVGARRKLAQMQQFASREPLWPVLHATDGVQVQEELPAPTVGPVRGRAQQQRKHITTEKPKPKPKPCRRVAGNMDFGVQVYAPEPPQAPSSTQVCCSSTDLEL